VAVAHEFGAAHERGVLLLAHAVGGVVVHGDHLGAGEHRQSEGIAHEFRNADESDRESQFIDRAPCASDDLTGCKVASHRVKGDGQAQLS